MTFGSLFAGIGGMDLGLERAGLKCVWQVEIDEYARRVLAKHWPAVRRWDDVRTFPPEGDWSCDVIAGGFPCQDISNAGKRAGIEGERSGLWAEYHRVIRVLRPRIVLVENVAALLSNGLGRVLGDLAAFGYDAEWDCVPAESVGAPHQRDRIFVVAHLASEHGSRRRSSGGIESNAAQSKEVQEHAADADGQHGRTGRPRRSSRRSARPDQQARREAVRDADRERPPFGTCFGSDVQEELASAQRANSTGNGHWATEPDVVRMVHGVPDRVDRIRGLGNAVVPQVAEWIGRRLIALTA